MTTTALPTCLEFRAATCFISDCYDRASAEPHTLRVDHGGAQEGRDGAVYCRAALLQHVPGRPTSFRYA